MSGDSERGRGRTVAGRVGEAALKVLSLFVILEPIWMLLPFAGFLYGSVLHIQTLSREPATAWLTHFVFPVLAFGLVGPILGALGLLVFLVGAGQIYAAKLRRSGLVTGGLYRFVRHPQYTALTLFGIGILLTWGRALAYVAFFLMMYLYYWLAKLEERNCRRLFGDEYDRYRERTAFAFPGDRGLRELLARLPGRSLPGSVRAVAGLLLTAALCFGTMRLVVAVKEARRTIPYLTAEIAFVGAPAGEPEPADVEAGRAGAVRFVSSGRAAVVRGPYRNAAAPGFAERVLLRVRESAALHSFCGFLDADGPDLLVAFGLPFDQGGDGAGPEERREDGEGRGPPPDPHGPDRITLFLFRVTPEPGADFERVLASRDARTLRGACRAPVNLAAPAGSDIVEGEVFRPGPRFPAEDRWEALLRLTAEQPGADGAGPDTALVPGAHASVRLVMVRAPIYRTRRDPAFAEEILRRLEGSAKLRDHLRNTGAGGDVVAVAFPTPGPDWYREHHGRPVLHIFVVLVRPHDSDADTTALFDRPRRDLLGAFFAELDFKIEATADSLGAITPLGPRRDLEERFEFFLSGI